MKFYYKFYSIIIIGVMIKEIFILEFKIPLIKILIYLKIMQKICSEKNFDNVGNAV